MKKITMKVGMLAKELGYRDGSNRWTYYSKQYGAWYSTNVDGGIAKNEKTFQQCTQSELQAWLRKKGIDVYTIPTTYDGDKTYSAVLHTADEMKYVKTGVKSYEKAIELGLFEGLKKLKK